MQIINSLYSNDKKYSILYENVCFIYVTTSIIKEFISIFDFNDMTNSMWNLLCERLEKEIDENNENRRKRRKTRSKQNGNFLQTTNCFYPPENENSFDGILSFLRNKTNNNINSVVNITSSSCFSPSENNQPENVVIYEDRKKAFWSDLIKNSWLCIEFKENRIIPSDYKIRSCSCSPNWAHPKSWVIETSNDNESWSIIDEVTNCPFLNGQGLVHTFKIKKELKDEVRFIRMRGIGPDWQGTSSLMIDSIEFYGTLL